MKVTHFPPLIILMAFLINGFAVADDCTTADLNSSSSSPLRSVPVYDQDGTGTCYAHVAAQLVSYRELKRGQGKEAVVNPIYAAYIDHCVARDQQTLDSGNVSATINSLRALGSCSATGVQTCLKGLKSKSNMTDAEIAYYVQTLFAKYEAEKKKTPFDYTGATNRALAIMKADKRVGDRCDKLNETYKPLLWSWNWMSAGVAFDAIFEGCAPRRSLFATPPPSTTNASAPMATGTNDLNATIHNNLLKGYPVGVSLCAAALTNQQYHGLDGTTRKVINENACGRHAVMVTARARIGGACKLMVRNSWGANWHPKNTACACIRKDGSYQQVCSDYSLAKEVVGCWYDRTHLLENTYSATSI